MGVYYMLELEKGRSARHDAYSQVRLRSVYQIITCILSHDGGFNIVPDSTVRVF